MVRVFTIQLVQVSANADFARMMPSFSNDWSDSQGGDRASPDYSRSKQQVVYGRSGYQRLT